MLSILPFAILQGSSCYWHHPSHVHVRSAPCWQQCEQTPELRRLFRHAILSGTLLPQPHCVVCCRLLLWCEPCASVSCKMHISGHAPNRGQHQLCEYACPHMPPAQAGLIPLSLCCDCAGVCDPVRQAVTGQVLAHHQHVRYRAQVSVNTPHMLHLSIATVTVQACPAGQARIRTVMGLAAWDSEFEPYLRTPDIGTANAVAFAVCLSDMLSMCIPFAE